MAYRKKKWWEKISPSLYLMIAILTISGVSLHDSETALKRATMALERTENSTASKPTTMRVTAYTPLSGKTATLKVVKVGRDVAVSRDRLDLLGREVFIMCEGTPVGMRVVNDLAAENMTNTIDVLVPDNHTAKQFGEQQCQVIPIPTVKN